MSARRSDAFGPVKHTPQRFLSLRDVLERLTISRSLLYELIKDPVRPFPSPVHLGRRSLWVEGEVEAYMGAVVEAERKN
jgi:predicted DNA-binding transcriptional regulator AlpA